MKRAARVGSFTLAWLAFGAAVPAQDPAKPPQDLAAPAPDPATRGPLGWRAEPATLVVWNRPIVRFRATVGGNEPAERVDNARRRLDALIVRAVPDVKKAIRWNSPFYGIEGQGWFFSYHCFTKYIKLGFLNGASLRPLPPIESKHDQTRYFHIHEHDPLDEPLLTTWITQAAKLPGEPLF